MSQELAIGNYLILSYNQFQNYRFQNFHINQNATYQGLTYNFMPFGFSGVTVNRSGDNTEASLVFPSNELSRAWSVSALENRWLATVYVLMLNPDSTSTGTLLHQYVGQVAQGEWDETTITLALNTVLDAVGSDVPTRRLTQTLVGALPVTSNVRLQ